MIISKTITNLRDQFPPGLIFQTNESKISITKILATFREDAILSRTQFTYALHSLLSRFKLISVFQQQRRLNFLNNFAFQKHLIKLWFAKFGVHSEDRRHYSAAIILELFSTTVLILVDRDAITDTTFRPSTL